MKFVLPDFIVWVKYRFYIIKKKKGDSINIVLQQSLYSDI